MLADGQSIIGHNSNTSAWILINENILVAIIFLVASFISWPGKSDLKGNRWTISVAGWTLAIVLLNILMVSYQDSMCLLTGYSRKEFLSMTPFEILDDDGKKEFLRRTNMWLSGEKPDENIVYKVIAKDRHLIYAILNVKFKAGEQGNPVGAMVVAHDITERKRSEDALAFQAQLLSEVYDAVFSSDTNFTITYWNRGAEKLFGWTQEEALGKNSGELLKPKIAGSSRDRERSKLRSEGHWEGEVEYMRKDGTYFIFEVNSTVLKDSNGKDIGNVVVARDITERKKSEERFRTIAESLPILISITHTETSTIAYTNSAYNEAFGFQKEDIIGRKGPDVYYDPEDRERMIEAIRKEGFLSNYQLKAKKSDGSPIWLLSFVKNIIYDDKPAIMGASIDITKRIMAQEALKISQEKLNIALENGHIGVWEWDLKTNEVIWDERMEKMFGLKSGSFGRTSVAFEELVHEEDVSHVRKAFRDSLEMDMPYETLFRTKSTNGNIKYISSKALLNKDKYGNPVSLTGVCFDVTSMREGTEKVVIKLNEDLLRSNKELENFAYVASHDLQEPLRMVSSFTQLLEKQYKDKLDDRAIEYIHFAVDGSKRMYDLLNGLLTYSRIHTKGKEFNRVDLTRVLENATKNLSLTIRERNVVIESDDLPTVYGDNVQLLQLFQNLIANSIKFSLATPRVTI